MVTVMKDENAPEEVRREFAGIVVAARQRVGGKRR